MAVLDRIRNRGILIATAIGIALLAFIVGDFLNSGSSYFNKTREVVAVIVDEEINIKDYSMAIDQMTEVYKIETGQTDLNEQMLTQIRSSVWESMVNEKILLAEAAKIGLAVAPEELSDRLIGKNIHPLIAQRRAFAGEDGQFSRRNLVQFLNSLEQEPENEEMRNQLASAKSYWLFWEKAVKNSILQEKYNALFAKSISANSIDAKMNLEATNTSVDVAYIMQPYYTISDSAVTVSDSDIKDLYKKQIEKYKTEANCDLNLVAFEIKPLQPDYKEAQDWMNNLSTEFRTTEDVVGLVNSNSDVMYDGRKYTLKTVPKNLKVFAFSGKTGDIYGPVFVNDTHTMARIMEAGIMSSDSVKLRHIFLVQKDEAKADSLVAAIRGGADFASLAAKYSAVKQTAAKGGEIGWLEENVSGEVKEIANAAFSKSVNEVFTIKNTQGTQILQVMEKTPARSKVKLAILERKVIASSRTYSKIYNDAKKFAASDLNKENFEKTAIKSGGMIRPALNVLKTNETILEIEQSRQIVRWAFENEKETVSDVFECGKQYVVAMINDVNEKGYKSVDKVKDELKAQIIKDKKADLMITNLNAQLAKNPSLETIAAGLKDSVRMAPSVSFAAYQFGSAGFEPNVIGKSAVAQENKISAPIKGNAGVFIIRTANKKVNPQTFNAKMEIMQLNMRMSYSLPYMILQDLKDKAEVSDNRLAFY